MASPSTLLGNDGRGYELARRLEGCGSWRAWLGDSSYAAFVPHLASPATWDAFLSSSPSGRSRTDLRLQLRARALLYQKASVALLPSTNPSLANLNPSYLQLQGDDVYYSLEDEQQDGLQYPVQSKPSSGAGSKYHEKESSSSSQRNRHEECPDTWYSEVVERYRVRHKVFPQFDKEPQNRTPEGMSTYLKLSGTHKRKRQPFKVEQSVGVVDQNLECHSMYSEFASDLANSSDEDCTFFPELMFPFNCIPDCAIPSTNGVEKKHEVEVHGVLDNLPTLVSRNPAMIERFGIIPEYHKMGNKYRGNDRSGREREIGEEEASKKTHKVVVHALMNIGFESGSETSLEIFSEVLSGHIRKLGRTLRLLSDSYKKQFSSVELIKMFLQIAGYSNLGALTEITKDSKSLAQNRHRQIRAVQAHQNALLQAQSMQQFQRQIQHLNMIHPQNLTFQQQQQQQLQQQQKQQQQRQLQQQQQQQQRQLQQQLQLQQQQQLDQQQQQQQWDKMHLRQISTPRGSVVIMDKEQPMVHVKLENVMESSVDGVSGDVLNKQQMQLRQQMAMVNVHAQSGQQFKQISNFQLSQLQAQNVYNIRTPPVKIEAFRGLVGGDMTLKNEPDHNKLTSSPK